MDRMNEQKQLYPTDALKIGGRQCSRRPTACDARADANSHGGESCHDLSPTASVRKSGCTVSMGGGGRTRIRHVCAFGITLTANGCDATNGSIYEYSRYAHGKVGRTRSVTDFGSMPGCK
jgi:hypothetical protein